MKATSTEATLADSTTARTTVAKSQRENRILPNISMFPIAFDSGRIGPPLRQSDEIASDATTGVGNGRRFRSFVLQPHLRLATVVAMTDCSIMRIDKATMVRVLHDEPKFSEMFMWYYWPAMPELKKIWSINFLIRPRNVWRGCSFLWRVSATTRSPNP